MSELFWTVCFSPAYTKIIKERVSKGFRIKRVTTPARMRMLRPGRTILKGQERHNEKVVALLPSDLQYYDALAKARVIFEVFKK